MATEHIDYKVIQVFDDFEIRQYPPIVVAETEVEAKIEEASEKGFAPLASYILGANHKATDKFENSPAQVDGKKMPMASPLNVQSHGDRRTIDFFLPDFEMAEEAPLPNDPNIHIKKIPERMVAAYTYSGAWSEERYNKAKELLVMARDREHIRPTSDPIWAGYNPPWWPWFIRRNEIWFEVDI